VKPQNGQSMLENVAAQGALLTCAPSPGQARRAHLVMQGNFWKKQSVFNNFPGCWVFTHPKNILIISTNHPK